MCDRLVMCMLFTAAFMRVLPVRWELKTFVSSFLFMRMDMVTLMDGEGLGKSQHLWTTET